MNPDQTPSAGGSWIRDDQTGELTRAPAEVPPQPAAQDAPAAQTTSEA